MSWPLLHLLRRATLCAHLFVFKNNFLNHCIRFYNSFTRKMRRVCHERWRLHPFRIMHPIHLTDVQLMPALIELMSLVHRACRNDCPCCLSRTSLFIDFVVAREECSKRLFLFHEPVLAPIGLLAGACYLLWFCSRDPGLLFFLCPA